MIINRNNYLKRPTINFTSRVVETSEHSAHKHPQGKEILEAVDVFEETHGNAKCIGEGLFARAYKFNQFPFVIKESLDNDFARAKNEGFVPETKMLKQVPEDMTTSQKLFERVKTEKGNTYLITTMMDGEPAHFDKNPWDRAGFKGLFDSMFQLDKTGIFHNDLNESNVLITPDKRANILDYQFGKTFKVKANNMDEFKTPILMMPANAEMFEMASLPYYLKKNADRGKTALRDTFRDYIAEKANYAKNREGYLESTDAYPDKIEYEKLQSLLYKEPSDEMLDLQAKKLQLMFAHRKTFSIIDPNGQNDKSLFSAVGAYLNTAHCAAELSKKAEKIRKETDDPLLKHFMSYENRFARAWQEQMFKELNGDDHQFGVYKWIQGHASDVTQTRVDIETLDEYDPVTGGVIKTNVRMEQDPAFREKVGMTKDFEFENIPDVEALISNEDKEAIPVVNTFESVLKDIEDHSFRTNSAIQEGVEAVSKPVKVTEDVVKMEKLRGDYHQCCMNMHQAIEQRELNKAIPNAMKAGYIGSLINEHGKQIVEASEDKAVKKYAVENMRVVHNVELDSICSNMVETMTRAIKGGKNEKILQNLGDMVLKKCKPYDFLKSVR